MEVLVVIPALNLEVNDIGQALRWIAAQGHGVTCLSASSNPSKSIRHSPKVTTEGNLRILRPWLNYELAADFPEAAAFMARRVLAKSRFDVILCVQDFNMPVTRWILKLSGQEIPVAVLFEQAWRAASSEMGRVRTRIARGVRGLPRGGGFYGWVAERADAIITSDPDDVRHLQELRSWHPRTVYVPWCTDPGPITPSDSREPGVTMFAGGLPTHKNPGELVSIVNQLVGAGLVRKFVLATASQFELLARRSGAVLGPRLDLRLNLTLREVAELLSKVHYAVTAASPGGWGFIGNCWATGTPLVAIHPNSFIRSSNVVLPAWEYPSPVDAVRTLLADEGLQRSITSAAQVCFEEHHSASAVGSQLLNLLQGIAGR